MPVAKYWTGSQWVQLPASAAGQMWKQIIGDGVTTTFAIWHGLGSRDVIVACYRNSAPYEEVLVDVERTDTNTVTIKTLPYIPAANELTVIIASGGTAALANITMDVWHTVGAAGEPAFQGAWTSYDAGAQFQVPGFRKMLDGRVMLRGQLKNGASGTPAFTLPVGYRPTKAHRFSGVEQGTAGPTTDWNQVNIYANGDVQPYSNTTAISSLDGIEFDTESVFQAAQVGAQPLDNWHNVGAAGEPAFSSSGNYGAANSDTVGFRRFPDGRVRLKGIWANPTIGATTNVFVLPSGYRPPFIQRFVVPGSAGSFYVQVLVDGTVQFSSVAGFQTAAGWVDLSPIEFDTQSQISFINAVVPLSAPPKVTSLPVAPVDGQECYFVADAANGIIWHLRYNAGSSSAYKWEVVGGSPLAINDDTNLTLANSAFTNGGALVVPLAGVYDLESDVNMYFTSAAGGHTMQLMTGATQWLYGTQSSSSAGNAVSIAATSKRKTVPAGSSLQTQYYVPGTGGIARFRNLSAMPVRVG